jgi:hypothetical protein
MLVNARKCSRMLGNARRCSEMLGNAPTCSEMRPIAPRAVRPWPQTTSFPRPLVVACTTQQQQQQPQQPQQPTNRSYDSGITWQLPTTSGLLLLQPTPTTRPRLVADNFFPSATTCCCMYNNNINNNQPQLRLGYHSAVADDEWFIVVETDAPNYAVVPSPPCLCFVSTTRRLVSTMPSPRLCS